MSGEQKVSFTVRRPTPISRDTSSGPDSDGGSSFKVPNLPRHLLQDSTPGSPLARSATSSPKLTHDRTHYYGEGNSSSDEDDSQQDELVTGFDQFGVERLHKVKKVPQGPLVIPALKNRDWREIARKRRTTNQFLPDSARAGQTGADGSIGGLGTRERIGDGPQLAGLQLRKKEVSFLKTESEDFEMKEVIVKEEGNVVEETEDQRALRAILAGVDGGEDSVLEIPAISAPISEEEAYKQDVNELPDSATLDDYSRVPVEQFGAALLRGMGWKEGTAASRKGKGIAEPYIPEARPALLGIGAKEMETFDDGSAKRSKRPERRYVPVVKRDRDGNVVDDSNEGKMGRNRGSDRHRERSISPRRESRTSSRRGSPERKDYDDRRRDRDGGRKHDDERDRDRDYRRRETRDREREKRRDRSRDRRRDDSR
ncbi:hypothetical protein L218DRAFT_852827 [Marasmius fiardii PR-910]|nr:hypothetical protein L218DRAFT_852827 [Marasmius fiardii PR-910]